MKKFHVISYQHNKLEYYDVLPYFRDAWENGRFQSAQVLTKPKLKEWIEIASRYQFQSRCEYECMLANWPFGSYRINERIEAYLKHHIDFNIKDYRQNIDFMNIIMSEMYKIDIHEQIMMNIDIITDILMEEFLCSNN